MDDRQTTELLDQFLALMPDAAVVDGGGCIVLANPDLLAVGPQLQVGLTPVIIADEVEWSDADAVENERSSLAAALEQWRVE